MKWHEDEMSEGFEQVEGPGRYWGTVAQIKESKTSDGYGMWGLRFEEIDTGKTICWDNLVFNKTGKGIALKKMSILGIQKDSNGFFEIHDSQDLKGMGCYINVKEGEYQGKKRLEVDSYGGGFFGYEPIEDNVEEKEREIDVNADIPF